MAEPGPGGLHAVTPDGPLYRIARRPDPWAFADWSHVGRDGTFGNRWDDPEGVYRVVYASSSRLGAFVEVLARFRPDPEVAKELARIEGDDDDDVEPPGALDPAWLARRALGSAQLEGHFVDVSHSRSLSQLRRALGARLAHHGLEDLDAASVRLAAPRRFTQEVSRYVYQQSTLGGERRFAGIAYRSRLGDDFRNWAIFEPAGGAMPWAEEPDAAPIAADDPDLLRALALLGVRLTD